jgi:hypothetical protein
MSDDNYPRPTRWWARHVQVYVTLWLTGAGSLMLVTSIWAWNIADRAGDTGVQAVHWIGPDFSASPGTAALVLAAVAAAAASFIHSTAQFAPHKRNRRRDNTDLAWYVLRPLNAALLGMVTVVLIRSGLISIGTPGDTGTAAAGFEAGAIAGLCTDRLLNLIDRLASLRTAAGSSSTDQNPAAAKPAKPKKPAKQTRATPAATAQDNPAPPTNAHTGVHGDEPASRTDVRTAIAQEHRPASQAEAPTAAPTDVPPRDTTPLQQSTPVAAEPAAAAATQPEPRAA